MSVKKYRRQGPELPIRGNFSRAERRRLRLVYERGIAYGHKLGRDGERREILAMVEDKDYISRLLNDAARGHDY